MPELIPAGPGTDRCLAENRALYCWLPAGHEGLHYDNIDDVSWTEGRTDA